MVRDFEKLTDEEIVIEVRSRDQELYSIIVERYQHKLLRYAVSIVKDGDKALDVVQESFIKAFINLNGFDIKKKFSSWIYRIVHNEAINIVKKYQKELPIPDGVDFSSKENIEYDYQRGEIEAKVNKCLSEIPLLYSEPLSLYYLEDKSYEEIGDILRLPIGTVATRINRAKIIMRKICQKI